jgi:hypothetical protein
MQCSGAFGSEKNIGIRSGGMERGRRKKTIGLESPQAAGLSLRSGLSDSKPISQLLQFSVALFFLGRFLFGYFLFGSLFLDLLDRRLTSAGPAHHTTLSSVHSFSVRPMAGHIYYPPWMRRIL